MAERPERHLVLPTGASRRCIVVGDVHGCMTELQALLHGIEPPFHATEDIVILAGDLVGKGPDSGAVVQFAIELGSSCYAVMGNWDLQVRSPTTLLELLDTIL
jgi:predicted phosphodiesterase